MLPQNGTIWQWEGKRGAIYQRQAVCTEPPDIASHERSFVKYCFCNTRLTGMWSLAAG